ncbi:unnamed protein product [Alopecurus aequalis]
MHVMFGFRSVLPAPPRYESLRRCPRLNGNEPRRFLSGICMRPRSAVLCSRSVHVQGSLEGETASRPSTESRIRKELERPEYMPSPYHTAWVAMVALPGSDLQAPCFPQCVHWIIQNQHANGSWGIHDFFLPPNKEILLSTLACVIALKKWNVGPENVRRGVQFIGRNFSIVMDTKIAAPTGFSVTFPSMLNLATRMGLEFSVKEAHIGSILHLHHMKLNRLVGEDSCGKQAYLAYTAECFVNRPEWNDVMKYKRKNGSLFNSPAATAASLVHDYDDKALQYLNFLVSTFDGAVPSMYPLNIFCQISLVDMLENIGISHYFAREIKSILDKTYSFWIERDEEIMLDVTTCAMAFRLLRMNGYDVSSDELSHVSQASDFHNTLQGYLNDTKSVLELYKASTVILSENELILENIFSWSGCLLTEKLNSDEMPNGEVEYALKYPYYAIVEPLDYMWNIEHFNFGGSGVLNTASLACCVKQDLLELAVRNFTHSQSVYQDELKNLKSWEKGNRLDQLQFVRKGLTNCHLTALASVFPHELSDARMACAKTTALIVVVDDFFDVAGSIEELQNLIVLVERWYEHQKVEFYSDRVKVVFFALYTTVNQLGAMASAVQNREVTEHVIEVWLDYLRSSMTEAEWQRSKYVPTVEEYMENAIVGMGLGPIVLTTLYFIGQYRWECVMKEGEYRELFKLMCTCGRLQNDFQTFEREFRDGKLNIVSLLVLHSGASMSIEEAKTELGESIASCRRKLLRLFVGEDRAVPRTYKDLIWRFYKTGNLFYRADGYTTTNEMLGALNRVVNKPLKLQATTPSLALQFEE